MRQSELLTYYKILTSLTHTLENCSFGWEV